MLKAISKAVFCVFVLLPLQPAYSSTSATTPSNKSWAWVSCAAFGCIAITPYFAYKYHESRKAEPVERIKDDEINAVAKTVEDKLQATKEISGSDVFYVGYMAYKYVTPISSEPAKRKHQFFKAVEAYNKEKNEKNRREVSDQLHRLPPFCCEMQKGRNFFDRQHDSSLNYARLMILSGLIGTGLFLYDASK